MMRFAVLALAVILFSNTSQAKMTAVDRVFTRHKLSELKTQTAIKSVLVHALPKAHRRLLANNVLDDDGNDDAPGPDELDLQVLYRRPEIAKKHIDNDISDYVKIRLAVARARALEKYKEKWANNI